MGCFACDGMCRETGNTFIPSHAKFAKTQDTSDDVSGSRVI